MIAGPFHLEPADPGPIPTQREAERQRRAVARLLRDYPERVSMRDGDDEIHIWRHRPTSSLRAFYLWLLAAFVAGAIAGAALTALLSTSSRGDNSGRTSEFEGSAVRAGRMVEARAEYARSSGHEAERSSAVHTGPAPSSTGPARATAMDELPASDTTAHHAGRSGSAGRDDPAAVLAAIDAAAAEFGHEAERMRVVTFCESTWNPRAVGDAGTSFGLWQFQMPTWRANVRRAGFAYSDADVFDSIASSRVAAWMWANGGELLWTCAR